MATNKMATAAQVQQLQGQIQTLTDLLTQQQATLNSKASASSVNALGQRMTSAETGLSQKASTAYVDQQVHAIGDVDADQAAAIAGIKQTLLGEGDQLTQLLAAQSNQGLLLAGLRTDVDGKAPSATVSTLSGQLTTVRNTVNDSSTGLVATKAVADAATVALGTKADSTALASTNATVASHTTTLAGKADATALATTNGNLSALATTVAGKALAADLATTNTALGNLTTTVGTKADTTALTSGLALKVAKAGDTVSGPLVVPASAAMDQAVRKSELVGGIQRPYRLFQNVGATAVGAYVRAGQVAAVTDALGLGQVWALTAVRVKTITAPTVNSTITITSGSTTVFSTTVVAASLPAVGKLLDLLTLTGTALPADVTLPATLQCSASGGAVFEIIVDGLLK